MAGRTRYRPPPLKTKVRLRNPNQRPEVTEDRYGRRNEGDLEGVLRWAGSTRIKWGNTEISWPGLSSETAWGKEIKAHRRDRAPETRFDEGETVYTQHVVFTIRYRDDVDADTEIVHKGQVFRAVGPPVLRGGRGFGLLKKYLEIVTELRQ